MRFLPPVAGMLALASCAVLQVDVDVYKGPLASHENVIPQRVAASTLGVQSDLIRLKEHLKDSRMSAALPESELNEYCRSRNTGQRLTRFPNVAPYPNDLICEVDAVLGLFEDAEDSEISQFGVDATDALSLAADALSVFQRRGVVNPDAREVREEQLELAERLWAIGFQPSKENDQTAFARAGLARAYSCFLDNARHLADCVMDPVYLTLEGIDVEKNRRTNAKSRSLNRDYRLWRPIVWYGSRLERQRSSPTSDLFADYAALQCVVHERERSAELDGSVVCPISNLKWLADRYGANIGFETIADKSLLSEHARLLFPGRGEGRERIRQSFVDTMFETSDGFRIAREGYNTLLESGLRAIIRIEEIKASADSGGYPDASYNDYESLSFLIQERLPELIQPRHLYWAVCLDAAQPAALGIRSQTIDRLGLTNEDIDKCKVSHLSHNQNREIMFRTVRDRIGWALRYWPAQTAEDLLKLHNAYKMAQPYEMRDAGVDADHQQKNRRQYGLIVGPDGAKFADESNSFSFALSQVLSLQSQLASQSIFSRGRLSQGIWTHIEAFIEASEAHSRAKVTGKCMDQAQTCAEAVRERQAKDTMNAALVRFSEKILGLANSAREFATFKEQQDNREIALYEIVLQRIGNSTMAVADDLYARERYDQAQQENAAREVASIKAAFTGDADAYYSAYRSNLASAVDSLEAERTSKASSAGSVSAAVGEAKDALTQAQQSCVKLAEEYQRYIKQIDGRNVSLIACKTDKDPPSPQAEYVLNAPYSVWHPRLSAAKSILGDEANSINAAAKATTVDAGDAPDGVYTKIIAALQSFAPSTGSEAEQALAKKQAGELAELLSQPRFKETALAHVKNKDLIASEAAAFILAEGVLKEVTGRLDAYEAYNRLSPADAPMKAVEAVRAALLEKQNALNAATLNNTASSDQFTAAVSKAKHGAYALKVVDGLRPMVMEGFNKAGSGGATPVAVKQAVIAAAKGQKTEAGIEISTIVSILESAEPAALVADLSAFEDPDSPVYPNSSKEALDHLIASLRAEEIRILREKGKDSESAQFVREALEAAYRQRADQIYIRPAISYLRTSYASSSLGNNGIKWRNLLDSQAYRSLPFFGQVIENSSNFGLNRNDAALLEIVENNDTQFWQNVNQVRVSGNGNTNYVVTKDDIGNWYVRGYSAEQDEIASSMSNLALFASGTPGTVLSGANNENSPPQDTTGPIERVFLADQEIYQKATKASFDRLVGSLSATEDNKYAAAIVATWSANSVLTTKPEGDETAAPIDSIKDIPAANLTALGEVAKTMTDTVTKASERVTELKFSDAEKAREIAQTQSSMIVVGLRALKTYHDNVKQDVSGKNLPAISNNADGPGSVAVRKLAEAMAAKIQAEVDIREKEIEDFRRTASTFSDAIVKAQEGAGPL